MASLFPGYEYDIFISYRQKDNKGNRWVSEFVEVLKTELESTFKEEISVYFDFNPHDGLLETHDVNASLKEKLKCLVFIPIISRTYCDPKSFAWEHEFKAFIEQASQDQYGLMIKLPSGNVASRVLPVRIHDLESEDIKLCESVLGGYLRGVEFIYKEPGVNKPLTAEDDEKRNLNKTKYRIQINKTANALKEIISGMMAGAIVTGKESSAGQMPWEEARKEKKIEIKEKPAGIKRLRILSGVFSVLILAALIGVYFYPKFFKRDELKRLIASGEKVTLAVFPFQNMTADETLNIWQDAIQMNLINDLTNRGGLIVRQQETINGILQPQGKLEYATLSAGSAALISKKLNAEIFIYGSIQKSTSQIRLNANLVETATRDILKSIEITGPAGGGLSFSILDSLRKKVTDFLILSKLIRQFGSDGVLYTNVMNPGTNSEEAYRCYILGKKSFLKGDYTMAREWYRKAIKADSNYFDPSFELAWAYDSQGFRDSCIQLVISNYGKIDKWSGSQVAQLKLRANYNSYFGPPEKTIQLLEQVVELDEQATYMRGWLGETYEEAGQWDKASAQYERILEIYRSWGEQYLKNLPIYNGLAMCYLSTYQIKKLKRLLKEADHYCPDLESIPLTKVFIAFTEKDTATAIRYHNKYLAIINSKYHLSRVDSILYRGYWCLYCGKNDSAEIYWRKGCGIDPGNPEMLSHLLILLEKKNPEDFDFEDYSLIIDKLLNLTADKLTYYNYLDRKGMTYYKKGRTKEALEILQRTWNEAPYKLYAYKSHLDEVKKAIAGQTKI